VKASPTKVGKYELEQFLGGSMAHVYRAKDCVLGRTVALKWLTEQGAADTESRTRFFQEARIACQIHHENLVRIYDFGEEHGRPFIVMEFLEGESLRQAIRNGHLGDFQNRIGLSLQIARVLTHIHACKIIHRDIKPENLHIDREGKLRLMDFGFAKMEGVHFTRSGFTVGTPSYMSPEQVLGRPLTPQADIYAFGILLFELFTGAKPIAGGSVEEIFDQILHQPLKLGLLAAGGVPSAVRDLIARCTAKDPARRPRSFDLVCEELERITAGWIRTTRGRLA
jgi:serine/threonine-protein kinase